MLDKLSIDSTHTALYDEYIYWRTKNWLNKKTVEHRVPSFNGWGRKN